ncbi:hypothetical protein K1I86_08095 [Streptococcus cristatus]|uniref:DUF6287 domain-containing protein n=1 Tax=Streptococcus cristatus TaxID=45634 RepID=UPI001CBBD06A|nr:DUF6287 domain-containing protein [Streptococcus cristatus]MBZ2152654.1 hypothetical protein [Streptococcus cristatus]
MKQKIVYPLLCCLALSTLAACSSKEVHSTQTSSTTTQETSQVASSQKVAESSSSAASSQSSAEASSEKTQEEKKAMDISALANGDYSSVKGTWQNAAGHQLVFNDKGLVSDSYELYGASLTDYGTAAGGVYGGETGGFLLEFIPKGIKLADRENFQDNSDASQDRLWTGVGLNSFDEQGQFYYRVTN